MDEAEHRAALVDCWNNVITKNDLVYVLGDAAFTLEGLETLRALPGRKILVRGNHDCLHVQMYLSVFEDIHGITKYKKVWLTHAPIHPDELRGRKNIHGHVHWATIPDDRYINVSAEVIDYTPQNYQSLMATP